MGIKNSFFYFLFLFVFTSYGNNLAVKNELPIRFHIDLNDRSNDTFKVEVSSLSLEEENNIFNFLATVPGTYKIMDMGRYVRSFKAFDKEGKEIMSKKISTNKFKISKPNKVSKIKYEIVETFDTIVKHNEITAMSGTSIEEDHAIINNHAVLGYFEHMQHNSIVIDIDYPHDWIAGTALPLKDNNTYFAHNFFHAIDSPILLGKLTKSSIDIEETTIDIYSFSKHEYVNSNQILTSLEPVLKASSKYLKKLPVSHYTFLFFFENNDIKIRGALEHSYSSLYCNVEKPWEKISKKILHQASHEFFHIITPLHIHSEIIEDFNFTKPTPSRHLWLYEGVTEWVSYNMLMRSKEISLDDYLYELKRKLYISKYFDDNLSLLELSLESYTSYGNEQFPNIYMRGALVAGLLDIRLLELSEGKRGLREVIIELTALYGPNHPFNDETFFDDFTALTYPEIGAFFESYVKNSELLPLKEYYEKIGITFSKTKYSFTENINATPQQLALKKVWMSL